MSTLTVTSHASLISGGGITAFAGTVQEFTITGGLFAAVQTVGTSAEAISIGDIAAPAGLLCVINRDPTNYVELALDSGVSTKIFATLMPGQYALWVPEAGTGTIYAKANTAPVDCTVIAAAAATLSSAVLHTVPLGASGIYEYLDLAGAVTGLGVSSSVALAATEVTLGARHQYVIATSSRLALSVPVSRRMLYVRNKRLVDSYLCLDSGGSDKVAKLVAGGGVCVLPPPSTGGLYVGAASNNTLEVLDYAQ